MSLLDPRVWLAVIVGLALSYGAGRWQQMGHDKTKYAAERTATALVAATKQIEAVNAARAEEQRRTAAQVGIANAAKKDADAARADAVAAGSAADRLRMRVNELLAAARAPKDPAAASGSATAGDTDTMLAELFRRADERAGSLATDLDASRIAGKACEAAYDSLTPK